VTAFLITVGIFSHLMLAIIVLLLRSSGLSQTGTVTALLSLWGVIYFWSSVVYP
jgi:hypothetical protein